MINFLEKLKIINGNIHEPICADRISLSRLAPEPVKRLPKPTSPSSFLWAMNIFCAPLPINLEGSGGELVVDGGHGGV